MNGAICNLKDTTIVFCGTGSILAPGEVKPGHIMLAPLITNLMAPKSTCSLGRKNGSRNKIHIIYLNIINKFNKLTFATALRGIASIGQEP